MSLYNELKRRNVFRVAIAYLAGAWLLIEVAGTLFPAFGVPDWAVRFVVIVLGLGFLPALIISWAYELTPEGLKREKDVVRDTSITHLTAKRLDWITIGLIAAALVFIVADRFWMSPRHPEQSAVPVEVVTDHEQTSGPELTDPQYPPNSIAVLSFVNMSSDPEQEYFSDGISEELLNLLAKIPDLRVISRSSAFSFKGKDFDIPTIAAQLHVAYILEGSVRKAGNKVRITAQLIETHSDTHLWSQTYDRELKDIFVVQDEISSAIVGALKERLGLEINAIPRVIAAASTEAHTAYLRGRYLLVQRTRATMKGAVREFEKAIVIDPNYARAHAELAIAILFSNRGYLGDLPRSEAISRATPHAERAMALDPNLAEAHATTGMLLSFLKNWEEALVHYQQAIRINPNFAIVYNWMAETLGLQLGRYAESFAAIETGVRLDPLSIVILRNYINDLLNRNRLVEADRELEKLASISPAQYVRMRAERMSLGGKWANTVLGSLAHLQSVDNSARSRTVLALQFAVIGLDKEALDLAGVSHFGVLRILGRPDDAVKTVEMGFAENPVDPKLHREQELALAGSGDYARAWPILEEKWQRSGGRINCCKQFRIESAAALITIRRDADEDSGADELLAAIRDNVRRLREAGMIRTRLLLFSVDFEEGLAAYLAGEREKGLALIARAAEDGYFILPGEAYLQTLYDDPGFAPIREAQEARQTRERNRFLAIVCTDNPYAAVWQPAEGTCERFAETIGN
jgi:TolB-like protein/Flp pilus assembly protein TadD